MNVIKKRSFWVAAGVLWATLAGLPAFGDDTELFVVDSSQFPDARPNVLLVIDTSGSMRDLIATQIPYDPSQTYSGSCDSSRVYWRTGTGNPPRCSYYNDYWFNADENYCKRAQDAFANTGYYIGVMAQFDANYDQRWETIRYQSKDRPIECKDDQPDPSTGWAGHGNGIDTSKVYAENSPATEPWTADSTNAVNWSNSPTNQLYTAYSANYLNWYYGSSTQYTSKIDIVKQVATNLVDSVNGINFGLMRYNRNVYDNEDGGSVIYAMENVATARTALKDAINKLPASGNTPLAETMYEAGQYYRGGDVVYGDLGAPEYSVAESRTPQDMNSHVYRTPIEYACQKNYVVYLSDGLPTRDTDADSKITSLPGFQTATGSNTCDGDCLDEMAEWMSKTDLSSAHDGDQSVTTYTIGFAADIPVLQEAAQKSGGRYFRANDTAELTTALSSIVTSILDTNTTFVSPTVSVNSFNRTQNLNDLYITMFRPTGQVHWPGNLKKYRLRPSDSTIIDANDQPAVATVTAGNDVAGFFKTSAQSFWSATVDGQNVTAGGAAHELPDPANRNVYTCLGCTNTETALTAPGNAVAKTNSALDDAALEIGQSGDPTRDNLIDFIRGVDVTDVDQDPTTTVRHEMGDPLHGHPAAVLYSDTTSVIYVATNDGYVHAINSDDGTERWAFIPEEFLPDQKLLYDNDTTADKHYGIDGTLRVQIDADADGTINGTDKVRLYFGMRRGGNTYYALDITDPDSPKFLWKLTSADLPGGLGQTWSNPVPTRININGASYDSNNTDKEVVVFGAGYDTGHDNYALPGTPDGGNGIVVADAFNGNLLWYATNSSGDLPAGASRDRMLYSFAADIRVIDLDGDKYADRMYAADMGGQVWRFDVFNGQDVTNVIRGGVMAVLGGAVSASPPVSETRRFYYAPDAALVSDDTHNFMHIGIGSGQRARPNSTVTHDRFYALRDYKPFQTMSQAQYDTQSADPILDSDLVDITDDASPTIPAGSPGWRLELREAPNTWIGEKVLAEARTFDNKVYFTTFTPGIGATANDCVPKLGRNRLYIVDLLTGEPVTNLDQSVDETDLTTSDRYTEFNGSISSEVVFLFPSPDDPENCVGDECTPPPVACVDLFCFPPGFMNNPVRTFWTQENLDN
jgi:type IV pilus assembly protein PilY1